MEISITNLLISAAFLSVFIYILIGSATIDDTCSRIGREELGCRV